MNNFTQNLIIILLVIAFLGDSQAQAPNFIVILVDDQGWTGTSVQMDGNDVTSKSDYYYTPNIEQLAAQGLTFSRGYAPAAKCSPSRAAILTGKSVARTKITATETTVASGKLLLEASSSKGLSTADTTVAEWLKDTNLNYLTAHYGKWHLESNGPASHGFDYGSGATSNEDGNAADGLVIQADPKRMYELTDSAINLMTRANAAGKPFYVQISHWAVHTPIEATQNRRDWYDVAHQRPVGTNHDDPDYAAMTEDLDSTVGLLLSALNTLGLANNTYVIYTSDNGSSRSTSSNTPLKRGKTFIYEGGIRVPLIIKGPNITAGTRSDEPVIGYDLLPTVAKLSGSTNVLPYYIDGENIAGIWDGSGFTRNNPLYFHIPHYETNAAKTPRSAIIEGNYKMIVEYETGVNYLHDLSIDKEEDVDIAGSNSVLINSMRLKLRDYLASIDASMPSLDPSHANFSGTGSDVDSDGMDDSWEFLKLLSYTFDDSDDEDLDGATHQEEYNYNSDPLTDEGLNALAAIFKDETTTILESAGSTNVTVAFPVKNSTGGDLTIAYTIGGTATTGTDYTALSGSVVIPNNASSVDLIVTVLDDNDDENEETIILTLDEASSSAAVDLGTNTVITITISDNECAQPALGVSLRACIDDYTTDGLTESYSEVEDVGADTRTITTTGVPNHDYRAPSGIAEQPATYTLDLTPALSGSIVSLLGTSRVDYKFGTGLNGVSIAPLAAEPFDNTSTGEENWSWVLDFTGNTTDLGADCNSGHLNQANAYHYHGDMIGLANVLLSGLGDGTTIPTAPVQVGWAADGFPIYYKYGYIDPMDNTSGIKEYMPNYNLKAGSRAGDGVSAPCGTHNGKYLQDYEYNAVNGGDLDECNGITGVTNEFPSGTYYYVITNTYPVIPRCFKGYPASDYGNGTVLPVELMTFDGSFQENKILLEWSTATETNNKGFEIYKSKNGADWEYLDFVNGVGTTLETTNYNFIDYEITYGEVYYQLRQIDFDGKTEHSETIVLDIELPAAAFKIYPNPTSNGFSYEMNDLFSIENISIFNAVGQMVQPSIQGNSYISLKGLPKGIYFILVKLENGSTLKEKIVKY